MDFVVSGLEGCAKGSISRLEERDRRLFVSLPFATLEEPANVPRWVFGIGVGTDFNPHIYERPTPSNVSSLMYQCEHGNPSTTRGFDDSEPWCVFLASELV